MVGQQSLLQFLSAALEPVGACMGLSGVLLLAFLLGFPANEIVMPVALLIAGGSWGMETDAAALSSGLMAMGVDWKTGGMPDYIFPVPLALRHHLYDRLQGERKRQVDALGSGDPHCAGNRFVYTAASSAVVQYNN